MSKKVTGKRWALWMALLCGAAWLAIFGDKTTSKNITISIPPAQSVTSRATTNSEIRNVNKTDVATVTKLDLLIARNTLIEHRKVGVTSDTELFKSGSWTPPPPPIKPLPPAPPMAPALPFTFIGKKLEAGAWEVFLSSGEKSYVAKEGITIENTYRVEKITPPTLNLTYLPLGQSQNLPIGAPE